MRIVLDIDCKHYIHMYNFYMGIDMHGYSYSFEVIETKLKQGEIINCATFSTDSIYHVLFGVGQYRKTWSINSSKWDNRSLGFELYQHPNEFDKDSYLRTYKKYKKERERFDEIKKDGGIYNEINVLIVPHMLDMTNRVLPNNIAWIYDTELFSQLFPDKPVLIGYYNYSLVLLPHNPEPIILNGLGLGYVLKKVDEAYHTMMEKFDKKLAEKRLTANQLRSLTYYIFRRVEGMAIDMFKCNRRKRLNLAFEDLDYTAFLTSLPKMTELLSDFFAKIEELYEKGILTQPLVPVGWTAMIDSDYEHIEYYIPYCKLDTCKIENLHNLSRK